MAVKGKPLLMGLRAERIIDAMRESVAEVGIAGSTFERVSAKAGVSRGLLNYHFGTKERLLVEVIRRDAQARLDRLDSAIAKASNVDQVIAGLFDLAQGAIAERQGDAYLVSELFVTGRRNETVRDELGALYSKARKHFAAMLLQKQNEGVLRLRFDAEAVATFLIGIGDGAIVQQITVRDYDFTPAAGVSYAAARALFEDAA